MEPWSRWRERQGLTQDDLALRVGVDRAHLSRIEHGRRTPSVQLLMRLCVELNLTLEEAGRALAHCAGERAPAQWHVADIDHAEAA